MSTSPPTQSPRDVRPPTPPAPQSATVNFAQVFAAESAEIDAQCALRGIKSNLGLRPCDGEAAIPDRFGLAFSGGGIRSACVALGVLQSLAQARILRQVHYISGISGGGYTLAWLTAWIHRADADPAKWTTERPRRALASVEDQLADNSASGNTEPVAPPPEYRRHVEPFPLHYLRRYSSYLNPRAGLFSGDTLAIISIYLRNVLLNHVMIGCAALAILLALQLPPFVLHRNADVIRAAIANGSLNVPSLNGYGVILPSSWFVPVAILLLIAFVVSLICTWNSVRGLESSKSSRTSSASPDSESPQAPAPKDPNSSNGITKPARRNDAFWAVLLGVIACACVWLLIPRLYADYPVNQNVSLGSIAILAIVGFFLTAIHNWNDDSAIQRIPGRRVAQCALAWLAVFIAALGLQSGLHRWILVVSSGPQRGSFIVFGLPAILVALSLQTYLWVGIMGKAFPDSRREWLGRASGYFLACAAVIAILFSIAYFGPLCMHLLFTGFRGGGWKKTLASFGITGGWLMTVLTGILGGRSSKTSSAQVNADTSTKALNAVVLIAPPVFIIGVLLFASFVSHALVRHAVSTNPHPTYCARDYLPCANWRFTPAPRRLVWYAPPPVSLTPPPPGNRSVLQRGLYDLPSPWRYCLLIAVCLAIAVILALRLDVNEFSLHLFYRNRLVRAFLGASRPEMHRRDGQDPRLPNPFTGFALGDDIALYDLTSANGFQGPYPIWGTCLNLTTGEDLAWQQRKGASFIYSPLYSGWDYVNRFSMFSEPESPADDPDDGREARQMDTLSKYGYRSNLPSGDLPGYGGEGGAPHVGTAMAASGAAVSPNSGYHTSAGVAALLTLFDVRLGWWTGNPRHPRCWKEYAPGIWYLLKELLGEATDRAGYVYLSDGGHFENLGIYELVRRHVRFIICSDADADPKFAFGDLGNAIDRCRRDFGVEINIKAQTRISPASLDGFRDAHYAVGEICYPGQKQRGVLLYIKSSLTDDEPGDVLGMKASDNAFPHNTTLNQFYDEKKFEAYRALGEHMMEFILQSGATADPNTDRRAPMTPLNPHDDADTSAARVHKLFDKLHALAGRGKSPDHSPPS